MIIVRAARLDDLQDIIGLVNEVFRLSHGLLPTMGQQFPLFLCEDNISNLFVAEDKGKIVSHMGIKKNDIFIYGHRLSMASLGSVCTHPDYRGQGIATALMEQMLQRLYEQQTDILTVSGGRSLYTRHGCVKTGGCVYFSADAASLLPTNIPPYEYMKAEHDDIPALSYVYQQEAVRYKRSVWEFEVLLHAMPSIRVHPADVLTILARTHQGHISAYVICAEERGNCYKVVEYAGGRWAVGGIIKYLLDERLGGQALSIDVPMWDREMLYVLNSMGLRGREDFHPCTYRVIDREHLWESLLPLLEERVHRRLQKTLKLPEVPGENAENFTHFLFDHYQRSQYDACWDNVLPIPLPWPEGLNYI